MSLMVNARKLFPRVSVILDRRGVNVDNGQGFEIVDPDRMRIAFKEEMIEFLRQAQSLFGLLELGNIARHCIDSILALRTALHSRRAIYRNHLCTGSGFSKEMLSTPRPSVSASSMARWRSSGCTKSR